MSWERHLRKQRRKQERKCQTMRSCDHCFLVKVIPRQVEEGVAPVTESMAYVLSSFSSLLEERFHNYIEPSFPLPLSALTHSLKISKGYELTNDTPQILYPFVKLEDIFQNHQKAIWDLTFWMLKDPLKGHVFKVSMTQSWKEIFKIMYTGSSIYFWIMS